MLEIYTVIKYLVKSIFEQKNLILETKTSTTLIRYLMSLQ